MIDADVKMAEPSTQRSGITSIIERLCAPVDVAWLAALRIGFGVTMAVSMVRFITYGWIDAFFIKPRFHFKYWGFGWVEAMSPTAMYAVFWVLFACAVAIAVGCCFRLASSMFALGFGYLQLVDVTTYLNHYYLAWLLCVLLAFSPAGSFWSVDSWRARLRHATRVAAPSAPGARADHGIKRGWLFLFRFQVGVVYTYAGLAKAQPDWLIYAQPLSIWLGSNTDLPLLGGLFTWEPMPWLMSWAGFLFDTFVIWFLLWSRTRLVAYAAVLIFHTMTRTLFPIGMFSVIMVLAALVFFPPDWPRVAWRRLRHLRRPRDVRARAPEQPSVAPVGSERGLIRGSRTYILGAVLAAHCALQLLVPMRYLYYGGDVRWHEQGMRFSWRVMVREKNGSVTFQVRDPVHGRQFTVAPRAYLTRLQEREMSGQPDLILQLAHRVRDDYSARLGTRVEVRVEALVSLNGRRLAPLIDPNIDLAAIQDGLAPYQWVLPAPDGRPPRVRPV